VAGRASIVGAAATHVGNVREINEDAHFFDADTGLFLVCDGMGGHAAGEVASAMAIQMIRGAWTTEATLKLADLCAATGAPETRKQLLAALRSGVTSAHAAIISEADRDVSKSGMGTTLVGALVVGSELVFAQAGDSRAYMVRDGIATQLTEDHTLLARLLAAGIDVDTSGEGARFRSMLTNALGIGAEVKVATFVVPLADGDRFLLCSDGIYEYVPEAEIGDVLTKSPSPARSAQKLIELALERGGSDNATALVVRVLEAGDTPQPVEQRRRDDLTIESCPLWGKKTTQQQRLRALRIAAHREYNGGERLPAHTMGDRVAWIIVEGQLVQDGEDLGPGALVYPESLVADSQLPGRDQLAITRTEVRALALRADDFRELCEDDNELAEALLDGLNPLLAQRRARHPEPEPPPPVADTGSDEEPAPLDDPPEVELEIEADEPLDGDSVVDVEAPPEDEDLAAAEDSQPEVRIELRHEDDEEPELFPPPEDDPAPLPQVDELDDALEIALEKATDHDEPPPRLPRQPTMPPVNVARGGTIQVSGGSRKTTPPLGSRMTPAVGVRVTTPAMGMPRVGRASTPPPPEPPEPPEIEIEPGYGSDEDEALEIEADEPPAEVSADDAQVLETITETSSGVMTLSVDDDDDDEQASDGEVTTPQAAVGSGRAKTNGARPKRITDNWDD
jgi:PPM family protein phosphatase